MERRDAIGWTGVVDSLRILGSELSALLRVAGALSRRSIVADTLGDTDTHPVPVILVHGVAPEMTPVS